MVRAGVFIGVDKSGDLQKLNDAAAGAKRMHEWALEQGMPDAGARSLVVSLWDANSQIARQFMVAFHRALAQGEKPHVAFRAALLRVRLKLPARWANWCLVGLPSEAISD